MAQLEVLTYLLGLFATSLENFSLRPSYVNSYFVYSVKSVATIAFVFNNLFPVTLRFIKKNAKLAVCSL